MKIENTTDQEDAVGEEVQLTDVKSAKSGDLEDELQKITDKYVAKIDKMVEAKSKEIMTV